MFDTKHSRPSRTDHIDDVLHRLTAAADRPWDAPDAGYRVVSDDPEPAESPTPRHRRAAPVWWRAGRLGRLITRWTSAEGTPWWRRPAIRDFSPDDRPRRRFPIAMVIAAVLVGGVISAFVAFSGSPTVELPPELPVAAAVDRVSSPAKPGVVVDVVGKVAAPGLRTLPEGSRVADAIQASGGTLPATDVTGLNLARRLVDGEQLHVGVPVPPAAAAQLAQPGPIDLNTASPIQLDTLPGVGSVTALRIVEWRTKHGRFSKVDQLREVDGIGPAKYESLRELVTVR
ncbi:competence protein ComEA [Actinokineospora alba]|uniref:Competence protein ComEA n=1 Tax=Actinokineospora alba TaxID=504798 RepID=A0A1H0KA24_9PSEU|nr:ComEA family DNA-binding protein [Actinokineospora alba]TDP67983.1 competence protein ComEA [Actinokineospora alba]SDH90149.1 competence protein ComEA [Actinokineospora alba]SDO52767.1 competence protein ComEA [Actinokineospora alba]